MFSCYIILISYFNFHSASSESPCACVPYYQCEGGTFNIYGSPDTLDQRIGSDDEQEPVCGNTEVCCKLPGNLASVDAQRIGLEGTDNKVPINHYVTIPRKPKEVSGCGIKRIANSHSQNNSMNYHENTFFGEFPWMVELIQIVKGKEHFLCGGSLISPSVILTGAHCVSSLNQSSIVIARAGDWDPITNIEPLPHQDRFVKTVTMHEEFNKFNLINDIAIVAVEKPFGWSISIDRICLPDDYFEPINCYATGWGQADYDMDHSSEKKMKKVNLSLVDRKICQHKLRSTRLGKYFQLHPSFICAGGILNHDTCKGDGGGPLVCSGYQGNTLRYAQIGIVSWGIGCDRPIPAVYTSVKYFYKWISDKVFL